MTLLVVFTWKSINMSIGFSKINICRTMHLCNLRQKPACLFKVNNGNTTIMSEIGPKLAIKEIRTNLTTKTPERHQTSFWYL